MMVLEAYALLVMFSVYCCFVGSCQKNLNVAVYVVAALLAPIPALVAIFADRARGY